MYLQNSVLSKTCSLLSDGTCSDGVSATKAFSKDRSFHSNKKMSFNFLHVKLFFPKLHLTIADEICLLHVHVCISHSQNYVFLGRPANDGILYRSYVAEVTVESTTVLPQRA